MNRSAAKQIGLLAVGGTAALIFFVAFAARQVVDVRQPRAGVAMGELVAGYSIGQTFTIHRPNFDRLDLLLATYARTNPGRLDVQILPLDRRGKAQLLSVASPSIADDTYHSFTFTPFARSAGQTYVVRLSSPDARVGQGVTAWSAPSDVYPEGAALVDGRRDPGRDLTFTAFSRLSVVDWLSELAQGIGRDRGAVAVAVLLLFLPGLALLGSFGHSLDLDVVSTFAIAPGLSIVAIALLYLWADRFGIPIVARSFWLLLVLSAPLAILGVRRAISVAVREVVSVLVLVSLAMATELAIVNRVDIPFWGDSYQHTVIVRLLLDHHGLFTSWQPYANLQSFTYHFGFHTYTAAFASLAGLSAPEAVIVSAQILALAAALASVALARAVGVDGFGTLIVLVIVVFFSPMPSYFVNWGRDTQLAGLVVLGSVGALWMVGFRSDAGRARPTLSVMTLLAIGVAGLGLTHYREVLISGIFIFVWLVVTTGREWLRQGTDRLLLPPTRRDGGWRPRAGNSADRQEYGLIPRVRVVGAIGVGALLLAGPWLPRLLEFAAHARQIAAPPVPWSNAYNSFGNLGFFVPWSLLALACVGLAFRLFRRQTEALILALWVGGCFIFANLPWLGVPAGAWLNNFSVQIGLFLPVSIAIGMLADDLSSFVDIWIEGWEKGGSVPALGIGSRLADLTPASFFWSDPCPTSSDLTLSVSTENSWGASASSWHRWILPPIRRHSRFTYPPLISKSPGLRFRPQISWVHAVVLGSIVGLACVGSTHQLGILDRNQALVLDADRPALRWIQANTPSGARFLVNSFPGMGGTVVVGSDAGWWLPLLANRPTTLPPLNYTDERMAPGQRELLRRWAAFPTDQWGTATGLSLLRQADVGYVFLGAAGGRMSPADFDGKPAFQMLYAHGPTRVYQVVNDRRE